MYDAYLPLVRRAGGVPRFVTLTPPDWRLTEAALAKAFTDRTRVVLFTQPHNPAARVFSDAELALLTEYVVRLNAIIISDEVWEHVTFDGQPHRSLLSLPDLRERTVKIGSAGKIFSLTGWKVGWSCAAPPLRDLIARAHQFLTFTTPPNLQSAVAYGLGKPDDYFSDMRDQFARSRDRLTDGMRTLGFSVLPSEGTYFLNVNLAPLGRNDDVAFCRKLVTQHGVAAIPVSAFYADDTVTSVVRLCFAKRDATIDAALKRLANVATR